MNREDLEDREGRVAEEAKTHGFAVFRVFVVPKRGGLPV
jgi:hypothetical protein